MGAFIFLLALSSSVQESFISLLQDHPWAWILFGFGFFSIGLAFFAYTLLLSKKTYMTSQSGPLKITVNEEVINSYLHACFEKYFPKRQIPYRFILKKKKMQVIADLPHIPFEKQKELLSQIEEDLSETFSQILGYNQVLELHFSFDALPTPS